MTPDEVHKNQDIMTFRHTRIWSCHVVVMKQVGMDLLDVPKVHYRVMRHVIAILGMAMEFLKYVADVHYY